MTEQFLGVRVPTKVTLSKYGLTEESWQKILNRQQSVCGACGNLPPSARLAIDHEHVKGWKKMPPERRVDYVRGLLCYMCNHYRLARGSNVSNLAGAAQYLANYEWRKGIGPDRILVWE